MTRLGSLVLSLTLVGPYLLGADDPQVTITTLATGLGRTSTSTTTGAGGVGLVSYVS